MGRGTPRVIVESRTSVVWDWSSDNKRLLFGRSSAGRLKIYFLEVSSGHESLFLSNPDFDLFQAKFSPDGRWVTLIGCDSARSAMDCRLFVVPLKRDGTPELDNWIGIDHPSHWDDKPRWSPDGKLLYFLSDRDGNFCLWAQHLDGNTKRPIGAPFPLYHFHNSRFAMINVGTAALEIDVARDKLVMGVGELTGNVWGLKR